MILKISNKEILEVDQKVLKISDFKLRKKCLIVLNCLGRIFNIKIIEDPTVKKGTALLLEDDGTFINEIKDKKMSTDEILITKEIE